MEVRTYITEKKQTQRRDWDGQKNQAKARAQQEAERRLYAEDQSTRHSAESNQAALDQWSPKEMRLPACFPPEEFSTRQLSGLALLGLGGRTCRHGARCWLHETEHGLLQLGIHFVRDGHHVEQHGVKINRSKIVLKSTKDADLKDSRLFHGHGHRVTLLAPPNPVLACGGGIGKLGVWSEAQATDEVAEEEWKMAGALLIVQ